MINVFFVDGAKAGTYYKRMFSATQYYKEAKKLDEADLVQFLGGGDVNPYLYYQTPHPFTKDVCTDRDRYEILIYKRALEKNIPMTGICRGGQFLNVLNKGSLWQHVDNHNMGKHRITDLLWGKYNDIMVSSTHHQMMQPHKDAKIIAIAKNRSTFKEKHISGSIYRCEDITVDCEILYYEETNCLCFQPHPEYKYDIDNRQCTEYYFDLLENLVLR